MPMCWLLLLRVFLIFIPLQILNVTSKGFMLNEGVIRRLLYITLFFGISLLELNGQTSAGLLYPYQKIIPIAEVKKDIDSNFIPDRLGDTVIVAGRVSVSSGVLFPDRLQVALQDQSAGIVVYNRDYSGPVITLGDSISVKGIVSQYQGLTQLINLKLTLVDSIKSRSPKPVLFQNQNFEEFEGKLVTLRGRILNKGINSGGSYSTVLLSDGSDKTIMLFISNYHKYPNLIEKINIGESVKIIGILSQHDLSGNNNGFYQILLRSPNDLKIVEYNARYYILIIGGIIIITLGILVFNFLLQKKVRQRTKKLVESEQRFADLAESTSSAILIHHQGKIVYANQAVEKIAGHPREEFLQKSISEFIQIDEKQLRWTSIKGKVFREEAKFKVTNGKAYWLDYTVAPIFWDNSKAVIITAVDVTARKHAEEEANRSEKRFESIANSAPVGIFRTLPDGHTTYVNSKWAELSGLKANDAMGTGWLKAIHPDDQTQILGSWQKDISDQKISIAEYRFLHADGKEVYVVGYASPEYDEDKNIIGYIGSITDITELKKAGKELRISEEKFRSIFENHTAIKLLIDPETGAIIDSNQAAANYYGWTRDELKNMSIYQINQLHENSVFSEMGNTVTEKQNCFEFKHCRADGSVREVEVFSSIVKIEGKDFLHSIVQDITEKKKLFDELLVAKNKAEESDRLKSAFLNNISHEIRTPLNGIVGFTEILKMPNLETNEKEEYFSIIEKSGRRMLNTITDIIEISKIEAGQIGLEIEKTNLNTIICELYSIYQPETMEKGLDFSYCIGLSDEEAEIFTDTNKITQVYKYMIENAIKFTNSGAISFGYHVNGQKLELFVEDTGIGLSKHQKELVFSHFIQGSSSYAREYEGIGLGLSIAKAYTDMLDSKIIIESEEGKGARFYFEIPFNNKQEEESIKPTEIISGIEVQKNILLVEDDLVNLTFLKILFRESKMNIFTASNGQEAVDSVKSNPEIDIVLMDLKMPVMDGFEATRLIKAFRPDLPIIAQTAFAFSDDKAKALAAGCDNYITKPIKRNMLLNMIASACTAKVVK